MTAQKRRKMTHTTDTAMRPKAILSGALTTAKEAMVARDH